MSSITIPVHKPCHKKNSLIHISIHPHIRYEHIYVINVYTWTYNSECSNGFVHPTVLLQQVAHDDTSANKGDKKVHRDYWGVIRCGHHSQSREESSCVHRHDSSSSGNGRSYWVFQLMMRVLKKRRGRKKSEEEIGKYSCLKWNPAQKLRLRISELAVQKLTAFKFLKMKRDIRNLKKINSLLLSCGLSQTKQSNFSSRKRKKAGNFRSWVRDSLTHYRLELLVSRTPNMPA